MADEVTFRALNSSAGPRAGGDVITKCQGLLPNKMQCTQAATWAAVDSNGVDVPFGQYCNKHKVHIAAGIHSAPVMPIANTGTVQYMPIPDSDLQVKVTTEVVQNGDSASITSS